MSGLLNHFRPSHSRYCVAIEFLLITGAVFCATVLRFSAHGIFIRKGLPYLPHACLTALVVQTSMYYADLYNFRVGLSERQLYLKLLQALAVSTVVLIVLFYMLPELLIGRGILLVGLPLTFGLLVGWRLVYRRLQAMRQFRVKVLILGTGAEAQRLAEELEQAQPPGYEFKGFVGDTTEIGEHIL